MSLQAIDFGSAPSRALRSAMAIDISGLSKGYQASQPVFTDVSLQVGYGESVAIIGANGAGKSTLLRCCVRLIEPDQGQIVIAGNSWHTLQGKALRKARADVGFIFQKHQLVSRLSVLSNVIHGAIAKRPSVRMWRQDWAPAIEREKAFHMLDQVGLASLALQRADQLSGGQAQRVAIARALMQEPKVILADEPTASLDPKAGAEVMALLTQVIAQNKIGLLMVSHNMQQAKAHSHRLVGLKDQRIALERSSHNCCLSELSDFFDQPNGLSEASHA